MISCGCAHSVQELIEDMKRSSGSCESCGRFLIHLDFCPSFRIWVCYFDTVEYNGYIFIANMQDRDGVRYENRIAFRKKEEHFKACDFEDMLFPISRISRAQDGVLIELINGKFYKLAGDTFDSANPQYTIKQVCEKCSCHRDCGGVNRK